MNPLFCPICHHIPEKIGTRISKYRGGFVFEFYQCPQCWYSFIANPWTEYEKIYSKEYYEGKGADPLVDYAFELKHPDKTIRYYEWSGIAKISKELCGPLPIRWLDYGCGNGGLVRFINNNKIANCIGFEEGFIANEARSKNIPIAKKEELIKMEGSFDLVTSIEVIEHVADPIGFLKNVRKMLKPGGYFFFTTGNSRRYRGHIHEWGYSAAPEVHISFFEPETLALALRQAGFEPLYKKFLPGFEGIIKFKALKNLHIQKRSPWQDILPWSLVSRTLDTHYGISHLPVGIAI